LSDDYEESFSLMVLRNLVSCMVANLGLAKIMKEPLPKKLVFRIRKRYFDAIVSGEKSTEYRPDTPFWRSRIDGKGVIGEPDWIAVFICGKRVHRRVIWDIAKIDTPSWFSEQGKKDVSTLKAYAIRLGPEVKA
jgi:hypothetical protein